MNPAFGYLVATAIAAGAAALGWRGYRTHINKRMLESEKAHKLAVLAQDGFCFSRQYETASALLIIDTPAQQWVLVDFSDPSAAFARPFSAIRATRLCFDTKMHGGVRKVNESGMLRSSLGASNRETYVTDTRQGLEIMLAAPEEDVCLYVECLDSPTSAERLQVIVDSLIEQAAN